MRGLQTIQCKQVPGLVPQHHHLLWRITKAHAQATVDTSCNIVQPVHHHPHPLLAPKHIYSLTLRSRRVSVAGREDDGIMSCLSQSRSSTAGLWQSHLLLESQVMWGQHQQCEWRGAVTQTSLCQQSAWAITAPLSCLWNVLSCWHRYPSGTRYEISQKYKARLCNRSLLFLKKHFDISVNARCNRPRPHMLFSCKMRT